MLRTDKRILFNVLCRVGQRTDGAQGLRAPVRKILILQLQNLGDSLIFIPALAALRRAHPAAEIHLLVNAISGQVYRYCPHVDRFWKVRTRRLFSWPMLVTLRQLRREGFDVILLDVAHQAFAYNLLAGFVGARERVGFDWEGRGAFCTVRLPSPHTSYLRANLELVRALGNSGGDDVGASEFWFTDADRAFIEQKLAARGIQKDATLVCVHPGSNMPSKWWFPDRFARVIETILKLDSRMHVILTGANSEAELVNEVLVAVDTDWSPRVASFAGGTSLHQLAALYERAELVITVDSGPQHLAAALGTPLVVLMSARDLSNRWRPPPAAGHTVLRHDPPCRGCELSVCPRPRRDCMAEITVGEVVAAIEKQLHRAPLAVLA